MIIAFAVGCALGFALWFYAAASIWRGREPRPEQSTTERVRAFLRVLSWRRFAGIVVTGGLLAVVVWHGLDDAVAVLAEVLAT